MADEHGTFPPPIGRLESGIPGLDRILGGGLPKGRSLLVTGETGTGKTVLLNEFLYRGITQYGEPGVLVSCEESADDIRRNVAGFGWDYPALEASGQLAVIDVSPSLHELVTVEVNEHYSLTPLLEIIAGTVERLGAHRVAIDSLGSLFVRYRSETAVRELFHQLTHRLKGLGVTALLSGERHAGRSLLSEHGLEEFVAEGLIELSKTPGELRTVRQMVIHKLRGLSYQSGQVEFAIEASGLEVFPRIPLEARVAPVTLETRKGFGIDPFDALLRGGLPEAHVALFSGNAGAGKSTFGLHFVRAGIETGEAGVYVTIEESSAQLRLVARHYGWDLAAAEREGRLQFIDVPFSDIRPDQVLYQVVNAARALGARRLVLDSISALLSIGMSAREHRLFLEQLIGFCKTEGITVVLLYAVGGAFGLAEAPVAITQARLSSIVDAIVLLRATERPQGLERQLSVVKVRGSDHDSAPYRYHIANQGIVIDGRLAATDRSGAGEPSE